MQVRLGLKIGTWISPNLSQADDFKRPSMRDWDTQVRPPTPIPMKFGPEVGLGPKPT